MKSKFCILISILFLLLNLKVSSQTKTVPFDTVNWIISNNAVLGNFDGREVMSGAAYLKDVKLESGSIEVDIYSTGERNFGGFMFRFQSFQEYEWCYIRMHKANGYVQDAVQYAPTFNGTSCWQLHGGKEGMAAVYLPKNEWIHMKIDMYNDTAKLYVDNMSDPVLVMDRLQLTKKSGAIGLKSFWTKGVYFSNFSYRLDEMPETQPNRPDIAPNLVSNWELSPRYKLKSDDEFLMYPTDRINETETWIRPDVNETGLININKYYGHTPGDSTSCAILRTSIHSETSRLVKMNFGYSDYATVFLNKVPIYTGISSYRSRNMAYGGWISYNDALYLKLEEGENEVLIVIAEDFGGWGFQAKFDDY